MESFQPQDRDHKDMACSFFPLLQKDGGWSALSFPRPSHCAQGRVAHSSSFKQNWWNDLESGCHIWRVRLNSGAWYLESEGCEPSQSLENISLDQKHCQSIIQRILSQSLASHKWNLSIRLSTVSEMNTELLCVPTPQRNLAIGKSRSSSRPLIQNIPARYITSSKLDALLQEEFPNGDYTVDVS